MTFDKILALCALVLSVVSILYTVWRDRSSGVKAQREELQKVKDELLILKTQFAFFLRGLEEQAMKMFHHPDDQKRLDNLIDKYREGRITEEERERLKNALRRIRDDADTPTGESAVALLWLATIRSKEAGERIAKSISHNP
jgi:uncharacterized membrane protein